MAGVNPWLQSIQTGLNDKSFENAYDAKAKEQLQQSQQQAALAQLLAGKKADQEGDAAKIQATHAADLDSQAQAISRAKGLQDDYNTKNPGHKSNVSVTKEGATISQADAMPPIMGQLRQQAMQDKGAVDLSKRYEKLSGFQSALQEVEDKTNKDGQGGVITNQAAKLNSTGGLKSAMPTALLGLGEMVGAVDKGTSDERKSLERIQLEYQKAMSGMRVTDQARKQEKEAMGWIASGDPDLVSKGVRALARNVGNATKIIQAGYTPDVRDRVHGVMGDPMDLYGRTFDDNAHQQPAQDPAAVRAANTGLTQSPQVRQPAPQGQAPGQAPAFDPDAYLKPKGTR